MKRINKNIRKIGICKPILQIPIPISPMWLLFSNEPEAKKERLKLKAGYNFCKELKMTEYCSIIEKDDSWEFLTELDFEFEQLLNNFIIKHSKKIYKQYPDNFRDFVSVYDHLIKHAFDLTRDHYDAEGRGLWSKNARTIFKKWEEIDTKKDKEKWIVEPYTPIAEKYPTAPRFSNEDIKNHLKNFFTDKQIREFFGDEDK